MWQPYTNTLQGFLKVSNFPLAWTTRNAFLGSCPITYIILFIIGSITWTLAKAATIDHVKDNWRLVSNVTTSVASWVKIYSASSSLLRSGTVSFNFWYYLHFLSYLITYV
jgi:hypothetical protein